MVRHGGPSQATAVSFLGWELAMARRGLSPEAVVEHAGNGAVTVPVPGTTSFLLAPQPRRGCDAVRVNRARLPSGGHREAIGAPSKALKRPTSETSG